MPLHAECPRCSASLTGSDDDWRCPTHDDLVAPLWRAAVAAGAPGSTLPTTSGAVPDYDDFAAYLSLAQGLATWLPWPLPPAWQVTDFGCVRGPEGPVAALTSCAGASEAEGVVELTVVTEEPGVGLGSRVAGVVAVDPGREAGLGPPTLKLRLDGGSVPLWSMSVHDDGVLLDRAVLVGEAAGRWLWVVVRPASAVLLLPEMPELVDVSTLGPELVALPFGAVPPAW